MPKLLSIARKQQGQQLSADEINQITDGLETVYNMVLLPSADLADTDFKKEGTIVDPATGVTIAIVTLNLKTVDGQSVIGVGNIITTGGGGGGSLPDGFLDIDGKINLAYLKDAILSEEFFKVDSTTGKIVPITPGGVDPSIYFKGLPGYQAGVAKMFYSTTNGGFEWGPVPEGGGGQQLADTVLSFGTPTSTGIPMSWTAVTFATNYTIQRDIWTAFANPVTVFSGAGTSFTDSGLQPGTTYYYRIIASASGFKSSNYVLGSNTTAASGVPTAPAPTNGVVNDIADTYSWSDPVGITSPGDIEYTLNGGTTAIQLTAKPLVVGNNSYAPGQVGVRTKAVAGVRGASGWLFNETGFTVTLVTPPAPSNPITDNPNKLFIVTPPTGYTGTDLETSVDSGVNYIPNTSASFPVGNFNYAVGVVRTRVKAGVGNNAGPAISNITAFVATVVDNTVPVTTPITLNNFRFNSANSTLTRDDSLGANSNYAAFNERIAVGATGIVKAEDSGTIGGVGIVLHSSQGYSNNPLVFFSRNLANFKLEFSVNGGGQLTLSSYIEGNLVLRVVVNATTFMPQYSVDGGNTWIGTATVARPAGILYLQGYGGDDTHVLGNIRQSGFTTS